MKKILIGASSSGGHIYPALEFGEYLKKLNYEVTFIGFKNQMEERILQDQNLVLINTSNSFKKFIFNKNILHELKEIKHVKNVINEYDVIILFGGFISFVVSLMAIKKRIPFYLHEQNVILGDSIKLTYRFSKGLFLSFNTISNKKSVFVGNPSSDFILDNSLRYSKKPRILFMFGSLGSELLYKKMFSFISNSYFSKFDITIVISSNYYYLYTNYLLIKQNSIKIVNFLDFRKNYSNYHIAFIRGGATTLSEIINTSIYANVIPSPYVKHNHQTKNTEYLYNLGLVNYITQENFNYLSVKKAIEHYLSSYKVMDEIYQKRRKYVNNNSSIKMLERLKLDGNI